MIFHSREDFYDLLLLLWRKERAIESIADSSLFKHMERFTDYIVIIAARE